MHQSRAYNNIISLASIHATSENLIINNRRYRNLYTLEVPRACSCFTVKLLVTVDYNFFGDKLNK